MGYGDFCSASIPQPKVRELPHRWLPSLPQGRMTGNELRPTRSSQRRHARSVIAGRYFRPWHRKDSASSRFICVAAVAGRSGPTLSFTRKQPPEKEGAATRGDERPPISLTAIGSPACTVPAIISENQRGVNPKEPAPISLWKYSGESARGAAPLSLGTMQSGGPRREIIQSDSAKELDTDSAGS